MLLKKNIYKEKKKKQVELEFMDCFVIIVCKEVSSNLESAYNYWVWDTTKQNVSCKG